MAYKKQNISFFTTDPTTPDLPVFRCIWDVHADTTYHARHDKGFADGGLFFTRSGAGLIDITSDGKRERHMLTPATVFLIERGVPCAYECHSGDSWDFYFFHFTYTGPRTAGLDFHTIYGLNSIHHIEHMCDEIIREISLKKPGYTVKTAGLFCNFLVAALRNMAELAEQNEQKVDSVIHWMKQNLAEKPSSETIIALSGMGRTALYCEFKKRTGVSPGSYFMNLKLEAARHMLESTGHKIKHITEQFNFYDEYYFSRQFKRRYGMPPSEYRKMKQPYPR